METASKSIKHIVILDDGKKGHLNQSLAVAHFVPFSTSHQICIRYKSSFHRCIFSFLIYLPLNHFLSKLFLSLTLAKDCFKTLIKQSCDIVISCGSSLNAPNIAYAAFCSAHNIVIMKPSWGKSSQYSLQIVPQHDQYKKGKNIALTQGAPTQICADALSKDAKQLESSLQSSLRASLGLFIGGNSSVHFLTDLWVDELFSKVDSICQKQNSDILITTSQRTPQKVIQKIKKYFLKYPYCRLLVIPSEIPSPSYMVPGMMGLSQLLMVTEDSISMISEAANSGKKVIVLEVPVRRKYAIKHRRMIQSLIDHGVVVKTLISDLDELVIEKLRDNKPVKILNDNEVIKEALQKFIL